jgi:hypothetical protein
MRDEVRRFWHVAILLGCACAPTHPGEVPMQLASQPIDPPPVFADVPPPPVPPALPNPTLIDHPRGCPASRTFADAQELCTRGIGPMHPFGDCRLISQPEPRFPYYAPIEALGGTVELFFTEYVDSEMVGNEIIYLAFRGRNGYALLAKVSESHSQSNNPPKLERFVGTPTSIEIATSQTWSPDDADPEVRYTSLRCSYDDDRGVRCGDACPTVLVEDPLPKLDCTALAELDWDGLSRGEKEMADWSPDMMIGFEDTLDYLEDHGHELAASKARKRFERDPFDLPGSVWSVAVPERTALSIYQLDPGESVLMHGSVPLLASGQETRVGAGPGGMYVTSVVAGERRVHRLDITAHRLQAVFPGACGATPTP